MTRRVGIIGCGSIARNAHLPVLAGIRSAQVIAIADEDSEALARAGSKVRTAERFSSGTGLISSRLADTVLICTPAPSHASTAIVAFEAGLDLYLEKPIATNLSDADSIMSAWKKSGRNGGIGFNYRFNPLYTKLRAALNEGRIGSITNITTTFRIPRPQSASWRDSRAGGGGALLELGSHHIDMVRFLTGYEIESVDATIESRKSEDDYAQLKLTLVGGAAATITAEFGDSFEHTFRVDGSKGSAYIDIGSSFEVEYPSAGNSGRRSLTPARIAHLYRKLRAPAKEPSYSPALSAFFDALAGGTPASPDLGDGYISLEVIDAAERSAASGKSVVMRNQLTS